MIAWGGIHNFEEWDPEIMEDRRKNDILGLGVGLAAGGYESNAELTEHFERLPECQSKFVDTLTGDALIMAA